jgi:hypothetical protein
VSAHRFLHKDSTHGYTSETYLALPQEPEAVSEEIQQGLTRDAHLRRRGEIRAEVDAECAEIVSAVERLSARPYAGRYRDDFKAIRAAVDRIRRTL